MKKLSLLSILCFLHVLNYAQNKLPKGVEILGTSIYKSSFFLKDRQGVLWNGQGSLNPNNIRANKGLLQYKNGQWNTIYNTGIFTDALEIDSTIYFANYSGIYQYANSQFTIDNTVSLATSITSYKQKIVVGTFGNGLYEKSANGYTKIPISIKGITYDSIYSLFADADELWIGTTNGLIKYDGLNFSQYSLPINYSNNRYIIKEQKAVISVVKDGDGKVWVANSNFQDSLDCLFFLENGQFTKARDYYTSQCHGKILLPYNIRRLALDAKENLMISMPWGILHLTKDSIIGKQIADIKGRYSFYKSPAFYSVAYCDRKGDRKIYTDNPIHGVVKIDYKTFSNDILFADGNRALKIIDINDLKTTVTNIGVITPLEAIDNPSRNQPYFNSPSIGCASAMYSAAIWMGGIEESSGDLHLAAETYRQIGIDFKPGPIDLVTLTYDSVANSFYNKIWKINRQTIDEFITNRNQPFYVIPKEILEWPAHGKGNFTQNLAPFVDVDNNGIYEPLKGDYPKIKGDQMLWWVFNDLGKHTETAGLPIGVEVHGSCYAYYHKDLPTTDSNYVINRTLFFDYKIINRSKSNYNNFSVGIWNDADLGNYADDYVGCHVTENTGYIYNGDDNDEGRNGFGKNPPHLFCKLLNQKMESFIYYNHNLDPVNGIPNAPYDFYNYMNGKWQNGNDLTLGNNGVGGSVKTKYMYDGSTNPATNQMPCWNEKSAGNSPYDRKFLMSTQLPSFKSDSIFEIEFAYIIDTNPMDDLCNVDMTLPGKIQNWYNQNKFPSKPYYGVGVKNIVNSKNDFLIYPNPTNGLVNIKADIESKSILGIQVFDNSGKCIYQILNSDDQGTFNTTLDINAYASGIYLIKIQTIEGALIGKVIKE